MKTDVQTLRNTINRGHAYGERKLMNQFDCTRAQLGGLVRNGVLPEPQKGVNNAKYWTGSAIVDHAEARLKRALNG